MDDFDGWMHRQFVDQEWDAFKRDLVALLTRYGMSRLEAIGLRGWLADVCRATDAMAFSAAQMTLITGVEAWEAEALTRAGFTEELMALLDDLWNVIDADAGPLHIPE
jgi:hypothetical protein